MTDKEFKNLLNKYQAGRCTPEEEKLVQEWYQSFEGEEDGLQQLSVKDKAALEKEMIGRIRNQMHSSSGRRTIPLYYATISAAAILLILIGYFSWTRIQTVEGIDEYITVQSKGTIKKVILSDGTLVWLKGNSELRHPKQFSQNAPEREVVLTGEALFEVAKNPGKPFFIQCGEVEAKVLGTSFNVREMQDKQRVEVVVLTGKVSLSSKSQGEGEVKTIMVEPMQKAIVEFDDLSKKMVDDVSIYTQGTAYDMHFEETLLSEVLKRIEQKFNVEIIYNELAQECRITADFTDQSLQVTLQMMTSTLGEVTYRVQDNQVFLQGKACQ